MSYSPSPSRHSIGGSNAGGNVMLRSTSQQLNGNSGQQHHHRQTVQLANYPEHLNPFYKDDHHKRIRFLKVIPKKLHLTSSNKSSSKPKSERRSSFSVDGIKEIWKLRPFRSGNKKPMPTHVTKTSESPPQLRAAVARQQDLAAFQDVPFQRSNRVRASMSEVTSSSNGFGYRTRGNGEEEGPESFARNTRYRSTMGGTTAALASPVYAMKPGTSQLSVRSTNPFEDDMEDDDMISMSGYSVASMPNRPYRKKRRAPLPPSVGATSSNKTDDDKASTNPRVMLTSPSTESGSTTQVEIITEKATIEIQNISSEIDALIRRTESRESVDKDKGKEEEQLPEERLKANSAVAEEKSPEINNNNKVDKEEAVINNSNKEATANNEDLSNEKPQIEEKDMLITDSQHTEVEVVTIPSKFKIEIVDETKAEEQETVTTIRIDEAPLVIQESISSLRIVESEDEDTKEVLTEDFKTLKIKENGEEKKATNATSMDPYKNVVVEMEKYDVRFVPLKGEDVDVSTSSTARLNGGSAQNSKTVKDIIDSINKSQSLLKINVEEQKRRASNGSINTRIRELERKESECNEMLNEIDLERKISGLNSPSVVDDVDEEIPVVIRELERVEEDEVSGLFKKCRPASGGNHDWNPLPKPKRSHSSSPSTTPN